ncbi:MAG: hypothetical protein Q8N77_05940 [Nanoarchaeota archaeon]|nr:hypothetical protein [Nanoarchaeota archaeon]
MKKAQVSLEFMFAIGLIVFIFLLIFYFTFERRAEISETEKILADKEECYKLADMITMAYITQSNYTFKLEKAARISTTSQAISVGETDYPCTLPINRTKNQAGDTFELSSGNVNVNYANGLVEVKNA